MAKIYWVFYSSLMDEKSYKEVRNELEECGFIEVLKLSEVKENFLEKSFIKNEIEKLDCKNVSFKVHTCEHCEECCPRHEVLMILKKNLGVE